MVLCSLLLMWSARTSAAQESLFLANDETTVQSIHFRFPDTETLDTGLLQQQIATQAPGKLDGVRRVLPFMRAGSYPFGPLTLQHDVARLRRFYRANGFLSPDIHYFDSTIDPDANKIRVVFTITEGPSVQIDSIGFQTPDGLPFPGEGGIIGADETDWARLLTTSQVQVGTRYSRANGNLLRGEVISWLQNRGYAFPLVTVSTNLDSLQSTARLTYTVDPGPYARFDRLEVEGHQSVSPAVITRELPFRIGDPFSKERLRQGQRELFALDLFRIALIDLPEQERDSTVDVQIRVRETKPQLVTYEAGLGREEGLTLHTDWMHRNFFGGARTLTVSLIANTGVGANPSGNLPAPRLFRGSVGLRQPYLFSTRFSGSLTPFIQYERDPLLRASGRTFDINRREMGLTTGLLYEIYPFRTVSLDHTLSRITLFTRPSAEATSRRAPYNRDVLTLSATLGRADDYLNPLRGVLIRPHAEASGWLFGSGLRYYKLASDASWYRLLHPRVALTVRAFAGRLWPQGIRPDEALDPALNPEIEDRYDPVLFYAGGGSDLRGWGRRQAGSKTVSGTIVDGQPVDAAYDPVGGLARTALGAELRLPFPGLGANWNTAVFAEGGRLSNGDLLGTNNIHVGTGAGVRYRTPVGFLRLDAAFKLNPDAKDVRRPGDFLVDGEDAPTRFWRRFALHFGIGQSF
jgi:outer membrane protein insertion porin family